MNKPLITLERNECILTRPVYIAQFRWYFLPYFTCRTKFLRVGIVTSAQDISLAPSSPLTLASGSKTLACQCLSQVLFCKHACLVLNRVLPFRETLSLTFDQMKLKHQMKLKQKASKDSCGWSDRCCILLFHSMNQKCEDKGCIDSSQSRRLADNEILYKYDPMGYQ